ncbi:MAG: lipoate protein ligase C-terminal domain-containing protein [Flavonifractor plautii]
MEVPRCQIDKRRRVEGCGEIRGLPGFEGGGNPGAVFYGDFFSRKEPDQLAQRLIGCPLREEALRAAVPAGEIGQYFQNMDLDEFCGLMLC